MKSDGSEESGSPPVRAEEPEASQETTLAEESTADEALSADGNPSPVASSAAGPSRTTRRPILGAANILLAFVSLLLVFVALPARWLPVDATCVLASAAFVVSGAGLFVGAPWSAKLAKVVGVVVLAAGLLLTTVLAVTAGELAGLYGPVGAGGALILFAVALLVVPYLVVFPAFQVWLLSGRSSS